MSSSQPRQACYYSTWARTLHIHARGSAVQCSVVCRVNSLGIFRKLRNTTSFEQNTSDATTSDMMTLCLCFFFLQTWQCLVLCILLAPLFVFDNATVINHVHVCVCMYIFARVVPGSKKYGLVCTWVDTQVRMGYRIVLRVYVRTYLPG